MVAPLVRATIGDAVLNRTLRAGGLAPVNHKRVYRIMKAHNLLLARKYTGRPEQVHDGKVVVMRSNLRWCSDGFEFTCWNGEVLRGAFIIDAHDREVIAWRVVVNAGISGSDIRDMMLEAVERRFGCCQAPHPVEVLTDNGAPYTAKDTRVFARQLGLRPCFTPVRSPQSNGLGDGRSAIIEGGKVLVMGEFGNAHLILDGPNPPLFGLGFDQGLQCSRQAGWRARGKQILSASCHPMKPEGGKLVNEGVHAATLLAAQSASYLLQSASGRKVSCG